MVFLVVYYEFAIYVATNCKNALSFKVHRMQMERNSNVKVKIKVVIRICSRMLSYYKEILTRLMLLKLGIFFKAQPNPDNFTVFRNIILRNGKHKEDMKILYFHEFSLMAKPWV